MFDQVRLAEAEADGRGSRREGVSPMIHVFGSGKFQNIRKHPIPSPKTSYGPCHRKTEAIAVGEYLKIRLFSRRSFSNECGIQTPLARGRRTPPRRLRTQPHGTRHPSQECRPTGCLSGLGGLGHSGLGACERGPLLRCRSSLCEERGPLRPEMRFPPKAVAGPSMATAIEEARFRTADHNSCRPSTSLRAGSRAIIYPLRTARSERQAGVQ